MRFTFRLNEMRNLSSKMVTFDLQSSVPDIEYYGFPDEDKAVKRNLWWENGISYSHRMITLLQCNKLRNNFPLQNRDAS